MSFVFTCFKRYWWYFAAMFNRSITISSNRHSFNRLLMYWMIISLNIHSNSFFTTSFKSVAVFSIFFHLKIIFTTSGQSHELANHAVTNELHEINAKTHIFHHSPSLSIHAQCLFTYNWYSVNRYLQNKSRYVSDWMIYIEKFGMNICSSAFSPSRYFHSIAMQNIWNMHKQQQQQHDNVRTFRIPITQARKSACFYPSEWQKTEIPTEPNSSAVNMNILPEVNLHSYVN